MSYIIFRERTLVTFSDNLKEAKRQLALADENMNTLRENELQDRLDIETINVYIESQIGS